MPSSAVSISSLPLPRPLLTFTFDPADDYPKPVLRRDPESQVALRDSNATLVCEAVSTDPSTLEVVWKKDGQVLEDSRAHRAASVLAGPLTQVRSTLLLERVVDADAGVYQCVVSNAIGSAYSTKAKVTVHGKPFPSEWCLKSIYQIKKIHFVTRLHLATEDP